MTVSNWKKLLKKITTNLGYTGGGGTLVLKEILPELSFPEAPPPHKTQDCQRPTKANTKLDRSSPQQKMSTAAVIKLPNPTFSLQNLACFIQ